MVSDKMIHYEKILALRDYALHTKHQDKGLFRHKGMSVFIAELNNIESFFKQLDDAWLENNPESWSNLNFIDTSPTAKAQNKNILKSQNGLFEKWHQERVFDTNFIEDQSVRKHTANLLKDQKITIRDELFTAYSFKLSGKRIFRPTKELCDALNNTKNTTPLEHLRCPYDTIYISIPKGVLETKKFIFDDAAIVEGAYVSINLSKNAINDPKIFIRLINSPPPGGLAERHMLGLACTPLTYNIRENDTVESFLEEYQKVFDGYARKENYPKNYQNYYLSICKILINIISYISCTNSSINKIDAPSAGNINKKRFAKYSERVKSRLPYYIIGDDIIIDNKSSSGGESTGTGRSLTTRFMVRGHYHHFWKKRTEEITDNMVVKTNEDGKVLVRKWLAPFWKGPEYGDVILKNYKVT